MTPQPVWVVKTAQSKSLSHSEDEERLQLLSQAQRSTRTRRITTKEEERRHKTRLRRHRGELMTFDDIQVTPKAASESVSGTSEVFYDNGSQHVGSIDKTPHALDRSNSKPLILNSNTRNQYREKVSTASGPHMMAKRSPKRRQGAHTICPNSYSCRTVLYCPIPSQNPAFVRRVFHYFACMVVPSQNFFDTVFDVDSTYGSFALQPVYDDEFHCAGLMAIYSSSSQMHGHRDQQTIVDVIRCTMNALSEHRVRLQRLGGKVDELAVRTALSLALTAEAADDVKSFAIHRDSLRPLLHAAGGLCSFAVNSPTRKALPQWERFWLLGYRTGHSSSNAPYATKLPHSQPPYPSTADIADTVACLPSGLQELAKQHMLRPDVLELLRRIVDIESAKQPRSAGVVSFDYPPPLQSVSRRHRDFWEASPSLSRLTVAVNEDDGDVPDVSSLIVLALVLYCCHTFLPRRVPLMIYRAARRRLSTDVSRALSIHQESYPDLMLWVLMNLIDSWEGGDVIDSSSRGPGERTKGSTLSLLYSLATPFHNVRSDVELQSKVKRFLSNEAFVGRCTLYWSRSWSRDRSEGLPDHN